MKNGIILAAVMAALCASGETVKTATQPWVRAYVATNRTDVSGKADATNVYTKAEADAKIVELSPPADLTDATNYTDRALGAFASTGAVKRAELHGTTTRWTDAAGCVWEVSDAFTPWQYEKNELLLGLPVWRGEAWYVDIPNNPSEILSQDANATRLMYAPAALETIWYRNIVPNGQTNLVGRVALTNDIPAAPDLSPIQQDIADLRTESSLVYRLYSGSNVVAEVTNYNSQVHAPELRLMQLNESNEYVTVWTETNGLARTLRVANAYADAALTNAAPRAWSRTTSGLGAEAPSNTTWISTPTTVIAGGFEYAKVVDTYGEVWVLSSNGMAAEFNPDTNAYFRISADDGTPVFSIEKTDAQVVGANAAGITMGETSVTVPVPVVSSTAPTMYWRSSLTSGDWADESSPPTGATVTWSGTAGSWVCTISFSGTRPPSMFFKFNFLQEGGTLIRNSAPLDVSQGIMFNGHLYVPSVSGNNLIWTRQQ